MSDNTRTVRHKILQSFVVDGDTVHVQFYVVPQHMGNCTLRILQLDTHELKSSKRANAKKALAAKVLLGQLMSGFIRPRASYRIKKDRNGLWKPERDSRGRILAHVVVWRWFRWVSVEKIIKGQGLEKKGSKWNNVLIPA